MTTTPTTSTDEFEAHRPALFGIAYRMLGSVAEAEDIVQEAWLRWQRADPAEVRAPRAYLNQVVTRLCLDQLKSARMQREQYFGTWLPEPVMRIERLEEGPDTRLERLESVSLAFLHVLERLAPVERVVFLLHEVFDYRHAEIAEILGRSESACRQALSRARKRVQESRPRFPAPTDEYQRIAMMFLRAVQGNDVQALVDALAEDAVLYSDSGGKAASAVNPLYGRDVIVRFWQGVRPRTRVTRSEVIIVNGYPAIAFWDGEELHTLYTFDVEDGQAKRLYLQRNPDKLALLQQQLAGEGPL